VSNEYARLARLKDAAAFLRQAEEDSVDVDRMIAELNNAIATANSSDYQRLRGVMEADMVVYFNIVRSTTDRDEKERALGAFNALSQYISAFDGAEMQLQDFLKRNPRGT